MTKSAKPQKPVLGMPEGLIMGGRKPDPAYWQALGRFIETFAAIESIMFHLLAFYSKVPAKHAAALFSGTRLDNSIKLIRRIIAANDPGKDCREELQIIFAQLTAINDARNDVVHYGSHETVNSGRVSSNWMRAHVPENITVRPMSAGILDAMRADLEKISLHLFVHSSHRNAEHFKARIGTLPPHVAWQYKPPPDHEMKLNKPARRDRRR